MFKRCLTRFLVHLPIQLCENSCNFIESLNHWINFPHQSCFLFGANCVCEWFSFIENSFYLFCEFCNTNPHPFWCKVLQNSIDNIGNEQNEVKITKFIPTKISAVEEIANYDIFFLLSLVSHKWWIRNFYVRLIKNQSSRFQNFGTNIIKFATPTYEKEIKELQHKRKKYRSIKTWQSLSGNDVSSSTSFATKKERWWMVMNVRICAKINHNI